MPKVKNSIRLTKEGFKRIDELLSNPAVNDYHKTLLKSIKHNAESKNTSKSDVEMLKLIEKQY